MSSGAPASIQVAAIQPNLRPNEVTPLSSARHVVQILEQVAQQSNIDLFVLPELCPIGYSEDTFCRYLTSGSVNLQIISEIDDLIRECAKARILECF